MSSLTLLCIVFDTIVLSFNPVTYLGFYKGEGHYAQHCERGPEANVSKISL